MKTTKTCNLLIELPGNFKKIEKYGLECDLHLHNNKATYDLTTILQKALPGFNKPSSIFFYEDNKYKYVGKYPLKQNKRIMLEVGSDYLEDQIIKSSFVVRLRIFILDQKKVLNNMKIGFLITELTKYTKLKRAGKLAEALRSVNILPKRIDYFIAVLREAWLYKFDFEKYQHKNVVYMTDFIWENKRIFIPYVRSKSDGKDNTQVVGEGI